MKFSQKNIENWRSWKTQFFWVGHFEFKKKLKFASSPWKLVTNYVLEWMGLNFYDCPGLQSKMTHTKHYYRQTSNQISINNWQKQALKAPGKKVFYLAHAYLHLYAHFFAHLHAHFFCHFHAHIHHYTNPVE